MRYLGLTMGAVMSLAASAAGAEAPLAGTSWESDDCIIRIEFKADGSADFYWPFNMDPAHWSVRGDRLTVEMDEEPHEFEGRIVDSNHIKGTYSWTDVAGLVTEEACVLTPEVAG